MSSPQSNTFFSKFLQLALVSFFTIALSLSLPPLAVSGPLGPGQPPRGRGKPPQPRNHNARTTESTPAGEVERPDQPYGKLIATLDYGTFQGAHSHEFNISYWQKIPFAAPPVGQNRFRAPQPPVNLTALYGTDYVYDSSQEFDMCPQRTVRFYSVFLFLSLSFSLYCLAPYACDTVHSGVDPELTSPGHGWGSTRSTVQKTVST